MQRPRDGYWQAVRGICIIAVVWIHTRTGADYTDWNRDYWVISRQALNFPVATFLFLSGYFVKPDRISPVRPWLTQRATRLLVPFFAWSLLYTLIAAAADPTTPPTFLAAGFLFGLSAGHLYFVLVLVQLTLLTPVLIRAARTRWGWTLFAVTPLYIAGIYWSARVTGSLPVWYASLFPAWFAFYYAGLWIRVRGIEWQPRLGAAIAAVLVALAASIGEAYLLLGLGLPDSLATSQLKASSILYAFAVINLAFALKPHIQSQPAVLVRLGDDSYGIYYVHMVWIIAAGLMIARVPALANWTVLPVFQIAEVAAVLAMSVASMWLARKMVGARLATTALGF